MTRIAAPPSGIRDDQKFLGGAGPRDVEIDRFAGEDPTDQAGSKSADRNAP